MFDISVTGVHCHGDSGVEFSDIAKIYLGKWGEYTSVIFSLITLLGAAIVYWVLMSNFLYHSVTFIYSMYRSILMVIKGQYKAFLTTLLCNYSFVTPF